MSFRNGELPSYDDIISGNFKIPSSIIALAEKKENNEKNVSSSGGSSDYLEGFKYKNVNKISEEQEFEEGELEEGEVEVENLSLKKNNNNKRTNNNINNNKNTTLNVDNSNKKRKLENQKKAKTGTDFTSNTTSNNQNGFVPRLICRYFMEGICSKGDKCTFSHAVVPNKTPEEARVKDPCKFFIAGSCMKGDSCYYSHDLSVVPCKFFHLKGDCAAASRGAGCRFSHAPIDAETLEKLKAAEDERIKEKIATDPPVNTPPNLFTTNPENSQTCKETETTTESPQTHFVEAELLNPFAGDDFSDGEF